MAEPITPGPKQLLVALDTNVLIDLANGLDKATDCIETIRERAKLAVFVIPPTVIEELAYISQDGETRSERSAALNALKNLVNIWGFTPSDCVPVGNGIVEEIGRKIRKARLLPEDEVNDSFVIAESALIGATILISSDRHIAGIDREELRLTLDSSDVAVPTILHPAQVAKYYLKG